MTQMAGCESLEIFDELVDNVPEDAFKGNFFEDFAKKLRKNVFQFTKSMMIWRFRKITYP